jgi:hypothetical protein
MSKRSLSYTELTELMRGDQSKFEAMVDAGMLDDETCARIDHLGRFFLRLSNASPNPELIVRDVFSEDEVKKFSTKPPIGTRMLDAAPCCNKRQLRAEILQ